MQTVTNLAKKNKAIQVGYLILEVLSETQSRVLEFSAIMTSRCHMSAVVTMVSTEVPSL